MKRKCTICKQDPHDTLKVFVAAFSPVTIYACENCRERIADEEYEYAKQWNKERGIEK